ncbi:hypothetical protein H1B31_08015 [Selenomonas timonae]|uniref:Uncharacterized protein n=1 Tax=Selenomonas timonae TaxID=2754044 RepID=A0A7G7VI74_9FIRM|nr:hypothetical protein [Selenomonas timonae]QNH53817.1 hypothetical protein H1B31_08015 [Selenomonas timonae]
MKIQIRSLCSDCANPPRFCDAILEEDAQIYLVRKDQKTNRYVKILWEDVVYQVNKLKPRNMKLPQHAP